MSKNAKVWLGAIAALVVLFIIIGESAPVVQPAEEKKAVVAETATPPTEVTAQELFAAYDANEARAQQTYGNRPLRVSGVVSAVTLDLMDKPTVTLATENQFQSVTILNSESVEARAADLDKGDQITALCGGVSEVVGSPVLKECVIE